MEQYNIQGDIKVIIFDLDGTLYPYSFYEKQYYEFSIKTMIDLFGKDKCDAIKMLSDYGVYDHYIPDKSKSLTDLVLSRGISLDKWNSYRDKYFVISNLGKAETVKLCTLNELKKFYKLYLVTNNTIKTTKKILKELGVQEEIFENIYSSENMYVCKKKKGKGYVYSLIKEENGLQFENMLAVGDRYNVDLLPLLEQGGNGILVKTPDEIDMIQNILAERRV